MKNVMKIFFVSLVVCAVFQSCAGDSYCRNDSCYNREVSSVDPYKKGDIAAWGTEKEQAEKEEMRKDTFYQNNRKVDRF